MEFNPEKFLGAVTRTVTDTEREGKPARAVTLSRSYDTDVMDLWDALTNPDRLPRWFAKVDGDFRPGGKYQVHGNASGTVKDCRPPEFLSLTWEFGPETSWVEVQVSEEAKHISRLTLTHIAPISDHWKQFGPGAVGVGWELGLMGMALYLEQLKTDPDAGIAQDFDEAAFAASEGGRKLIKGSAAAWGEADIARGEDPEHARAAAAATGAFFTGETPPAS